MVLSNNEISITILKVYNPEDAAAIGRLLPHLSERFSDQPIAEDLLKDIINSPSHDQLVARDTDGVIVGAATLSIVIGVAAGRKAYLDDFVVDPNVRGAGVGGKLWDAIVTWCRDHRVQSLNFTSKPSRTTAHQFYENHGAVIRDTYVFKLDL